MSPILYPSAIGPIRLTDRDRLLIWSPVEIHRSPEHEHVWEIEWLWLFRRPYASGHSHYRFAQFGPFDLRRSPVKP
jgi:hypothetical protein